MKRFMIFLAVITAGSCQRHMKEWPYEGDQQEVAVYVRTRSSSGITTPPSVYQLFVYDRQNKMVKYNVNPDKDDNNLLHVKLFPGQYTGYCITNAPEEENWEFAENFTPNQVYLKSQKTANSTEEAKDFLLGQCDFEVNESPSDKIIFELDRKVCLLKVTISNTPENIKDLEIHLSNIPTKMNLAGEYSSSTYTVSKKASPPDETKNSETTLLVFPPNEKSNLSLSYTCGSLAYITDGHPIDSILANRITEINANFRSPEGSSVLDITTNLVEWGKQIIKEDDWNIDLPEETDTSKVKGTNLLLNGSFEGDFIDNLPQHWLINASGLTPKITLETTPVQDGSKTAKLCGATYMYQDVAITGGKSYQISMYVNAMNESTPWRYYCKWYKGNEALDAASTEMYMASGYQKKTDGYINPYKGKIFKAPMEATKLRVEIRSYLNDSSLSLYVDNMSVIPIL